MSRIELINVSRFYVLANGSRVYALQNVSLQIAEGEFLCLTGPSGSGKTSLLSVLGALDTPNDGEHRFDGRVISTLEDTEKSQLRRDQFGFVFQSANLLEYATLVENIELPASFTSLDSKSRYRRACELLDRVGLSHRIRHKPNELSGGEKQRVAVARAMMNGAKVILADEPTAALDDEQKNLVLDLLEELVEIGYTVVVASHDPAVAKRAFRSVSLRNGQIQDQNSDEKTSASFGSAELHKFASPGPALLGARILNSFHSFKRMLRLSWLRFAAMLLLVAMSTATMLSVLSIMKGVDDFSSAVLAKIGANKLVINPTYNDDGIPRIMFVENDVRSIRARVPQLEDIILVFQRSILVNANDQRHGANVMAESILRHRWTENIVWQVENGSLLTKQDSDARATVAVIGQTVRELLFGRDADPIGERIFLGGLPFTVKGLLEEHPFPPDLENERFAQVDRITAGLRIFIPYATAMEVLVPALEAVEGGASAVNMDIYVDDVSNVTNAAKQIARLLNAKYGPDTFRAKSSVEHVEWVERQDDERFVYWVMIVVVLVIACGVALLSLTHASVAKRASEIGILRAFGARGRDVLDQWLVEASIICVVGGVLGYAIAQLALTFGLAKYFELHSSFEPWFLGPAILSSMCVGLCFGSFPLLRASKVHPTEALRMT